MAESAVPDVAPRHFVPRWLWVAGDVLTALTLAVAGLMFWSAAASADDPHGGGYQLMGSIMFGAPGVISACLLGIAYPRRDRPGPTALVLVSLAVAFSGVTLMPVLAIAPLLLVT